MVNFFSIFYDGPESEYLTLFLLYMYIMLLMLCLVIHVCFMYDDSVFAKCHLVAFDVISAGTVIKVIQHLPI